MLATAIDNIQHLFLPAGSFWISSQKPGKAQDGIKRGAQFVGHVGHEAGLQPVGGLERLKAWLAQRRPAFRGDASAAHLDAPRGILLLGIQGCGKSLAAKATAGVFGAAQLLALRAGRQVMPALAQHLAIAGIVGAVLLRYLYEQHRERQRELAESQARLQALQARIRPHFLFNSMNTIAALIRSQPDAAEEAIEDLADLFRASLNSSHERATLAEELDLAERYLNIEALRLGDRLRIEWNIDGVPPDTRVPPLVMQPLLENAVGHGIQARPEGGKITLYGRGESDRIVVTIGNPLPPEDVNTSSTSTRSMVVEYGLTYDDAALLFLAVVDTELTGFRVFMAGTSHRHRDLDLPDLIRTHYPGLDPDTPDLIDLTSVSRQTGWQLGPGYRRPTLPAWGWSGPSWADRRTRSGALRPSRPRRISRRGTSSLRRSRARG